MDRYYCREGWNDGGTTELAVRRMGMLSMCVVALDDGDKAIVR